MLEKMWSVLFYKKKAKHYSDGPVDIYMRITVDGISKDLSTKMKFDPKRWNSSAGRALGNKEDARELNHLLDTLLSKVHEIRRNLIDGGQPVSAEAIRKILAGEDERQRTILKLFQEHNEQMERLVEKEEYADSTREMYQVAYDHSAAFIQFKYKTNDLNIRQLDFDFVDSYYNWLKITKSQCHNTAIKNIGALKKQVLACVKRGWLQNDPFALFPMTEEPVDTVFLWPEELEKVMKKQFISDRVATVRDMFVFCCFTSLAFVDVKRLKRADITRGVDGRMVDHEEKTKDR